jgi:hypothetical protein
METAKVRIRPIRFVFAVDPKQAGTLERIFEINSLLWGGPYNFLLPLLKRVPSRYKDRSSRPVSAATFMEGLLDAFQPDFLVETEPGSTAALRFPRTRVISIEALLDRDDQSRCRYGVDARSLIAHLYQEDNQGPARHAGYPQ